MYGNLRGRIAFIMLRALWRNEMHVTNSIEVHFKLCGKVFFFCLCVFNLKISSYVDSKLKIYFIDIRGIYCSSNICRHVITPNRSALKQKINEKKLLSLPSDWRHLLICSFIGRKIYSFSFILSIVLSTIFKLK